MAMPTLRVVDHDIALRTPPVPEKVSMPPSDEVTGEIDGATEWLGVAADEILLAALGRTIARTFGEGVVAVDVTAERRWLLHAIPLLCASSQQASATEMLRDVHRTLSAVPAPAAQLSPEVFLNFIGVLPEGASASYQTPPGLGYVLELRVYREDGLLRLDWWYDTTRLDRYTIEELTEQFPLALFEMTSDAAAPV
jgi:non-ribosomal peptide synthetase component F